MFAQVVSDLLIPAYYIHNWQNCNIILLNVKKKSVFSKEGIQNAFSLGEEHVVNHG